VKLPSIESQLSFWSPWQKFVMGLAAAAGFPTWAIIRGPLYSTDTSYVSMFIWGLVMGAIVFAVGLMEWTANRRKYALLLGALLGWVVVLPWAYSTFVKPVEILDARTNDTYDTKWLIPLQGEVENVLDDHYVVKDGSATMNVASKESNALHVGEHVWVLGVIQREGSDRFSPRYLREHFRRTR
jgi:hypothetical protein